MQAQKATIKEMKQIQVNLFSQVTSDMKYLARG